MLRHSNRRRIHLAVTEQGNVRLHENLDEHSNTPRLPGIYDDWRREIEQAEQVKQLAEMDDNRERDSKVGIETHLLEWLVRQEFQWNTTTDQAQTDTKQSRLWQSEQLLETVLKASNEASYTTEGLDTATIGKTQLHYAHLMVSSACVVLDSLIPLLGKLGPLFTIVRRILCSSCFISFTNTPETEFTTLSARLKWYLSLTPYASLLRNLNIDNQLLLGELHGTRDIVKAWGLQSWKSNVIACTRREKHLTALLQLLHRKSDNTTKRLTFDLWRRWTRQHKTRAALHGLTEELKRVRKGTAGTNSDSDDSLYSSSSSDDNEHDERRNTAKYWIHKTIHKAPLHEQVRECLALLARQRATIEEHESNLTETKAHEQEVVEQLYHVQQDVTRLNDTLQQMKLEDEEMKIERSSQRVSELLREVREKDTQLQVLFGLYQQWEGVCARLLSKYSVATFPVFNVLFARHYTPATKKIQHLIAPVERPQTPPIMDLTPNKDAAIATTGTLAFPPRRRRGSILHTSKDGPVRSHTQPILGVSTGNTEQLKKENSSPQLTQMGSGQNLREQQESSFSMLKVVDTPMRRHSGSSCASDDDQRSTVEVAEFDDMQKDTTPLPGGATDVVGQATGRLLAWINRVLSLHTCLMINGENLHHRLYDNRNRLESVVTPPSLDKVELGDDPAPPILEVESHSSKSSTESQAEVVSPGVASPGEEGVALDRHGSIVVSGNKGAITTMPPLSSAPTLMSLEPAMDQRPLRNLTSDLKDSMAYSKLLHFALLPLKFILRRPGDSSVPATLQGKGAAGLAELPAKAIRQLVYHGKCPGMGTTIYLAEDQHKELKVEGICMIPTYDQMFSDFYTMNYHQRANALLYFVLQLLGSDLPIRAGDIIDGVDDLNMAFCGLLFHRFSQPVHFLTLTGSFYLSRVNTDPSFIPSTPSVDGLSAKEITKKSKKKRKLKRRTGMDSSNNLKKVTRIDSFRSVRSHSSPTKRDRNSSPDTRDTSTSGTESPRDRRPSIVRFESGTTLSQSLLSKDSYSPEPATPTTLTLNAIGGFGSARTAVSSTSDGSANNSNHNTTQQLLQQPHMVPAINTKLHQCKVRNTISLAADVARRMAQYNQDKFLVYFAVTQMMFDRAVKHWKTPVIQQPFEQREHFVWDRLETLFARHVPNHLTGQEQQDKVEVAKSQSSESITQLNTVFSAFYSHIKKAYMYYGAAGSVSERDPALHSKDHASGQHSHVHFTRDQFLQFLKDCKLYPRYITKPQVDRIFLESHSSDATLPDRLREEDVNPDHSLSISEFMEALVRVADLVYSEEKQDGERTPKGAQTVALNVQKILNNYLLPNACPTELDMFRGALNSDEVQRVLRDKHAILRTVFRAYAKQTDERIYLIPAPDWQKLMKDSGLMDNHFTNTVATRIFTHSHGLNRGDSDSGGGGPNHNTSAVVGLQYTEFLSGLAMVAVWKYPAPFLPLDQRVEMFFSKSFIPNVKLKLFSKTRRTAAIATT